MRHEYPLPPGLLATNYHADALLHRSRAHSSFRRGERAIGRAEMKQAVRCWKRFRLWKQRYEENAR